MMDKYEQYEETISLQKEDINRCKKYILQYKLRIEELNTYIKDQHDKYVVSLEEGRKRVKESNNKLDNFSQLFQKLSRDMIYLNQTTDLVSFSKESQVVMDTKMHVIDVFSPVDVSEYDDEDDENDWDDDD